MHIAHIANRVFETLAKTTKVINEQVLVITAGANSKFLGLGKDQTSNMCSETIIISLMPLETTRAKSHVY